MKTYELAKQIGENPRHVREYLREKHPRDVGEKRQHWGELSDELCAEITTYFASGEAERRRQRRMERPPKVGSPCELAEKIGERPCKIRDYLRKRFPRTPDKFRTRWWELTPPICEEITVYFRGLRELQAKKKAEREFFSEAEAMEKAKGGPKRKDQLVDQLKGSSLETKKLVVDWEAPFPRGREQIRLELAGSIDFNTGRRLKWG